MKILMVTDSFFPAIGGSETAIHRLSEELVRQGHTVGVAAMTQKQARNPSNSYEFWNIPSTIGSVEAKFWGKIHNLRRVIREFQPDVINAHFLFESGFVGVKAGHKEGVPCTVSIRGKGIFYRPGTSLIRKILFPLWIKGAAKADTFIATSQEMADLAEERHGISVTAISNGVDVEHFNPERTEINIRERHDIASDQTVIFCARRFVVKNGIEYMVRALPLVRQKLDAVLVLAAPKEREYDNLLKIATELGVADYIRFIGPVLHDELPCYYAGADVVVQPSIAEARSLACLEAMACGAAIVTTNTGGLKELITHGESGYLVDAFEPSTYQVGDISQTGVENLAEGVIETATNQSFRAVIKKGAREYALTCAWPEIARQSLVKYNEAIDIHKRA